MVISSEQKIANGMMKAVPFVTYSTVAKKFSVDEQGVQLLSTLKGPIAVTIICGRERLGKSYILNRLAGTTKGFKVGHEDDPCTKGLWLWPIPLRMTDSDGLPYNLVLLDSEGIDACDQEGKYSLQLFVLSILLSSLLIYNSVRNIDESSLDNMAVVAELSERIQNEALPGASQTFLDSAPSFLWLLRDAFLKMKGTPSEYLEKQLSYQDHSSKNKIREAIKCLFSDRECFTLPLPSSNVDVLSDLDNQDDGELEQGFVQGISDLRELVFYKSRPKQINGSAITGPELGELAKSYVHAINSGAVPDIKTSLEAITSAACRKAAAAACEAYLSAFNSDVGSLEQANDEHARCLAIAFEEYDMLAMGEATIMEECKHELVQDIEKHFANFRKEVELKIKLQSQEEASRQIKCDMEEEKLEWQNKMDDVQQELRQRDEAQEFYTKQIDQQNQQMNQILQSVEKKDKEIQILANRPESRPASSALPKAVIQKGLRGAKKVFRKRF